MAKKRKQNNLIKFIVASLITILVLGYSAYGIVSLIKNPSDTFMVEEGSLKMEETVEGYIIREEVIVTGENNGRGIVKIKNDGARVANGEIIKKKN